MFAVAVRRGRRSNVDTRTTHSLVPDAWLICMPVPSFPMPSRQSILLSFPRFVEYSWSTDIRALVSTRAALDSHSDPGNGASTGMVRGNPTPPSALFNPPIKRPPSMLPVHPSASPPCQRLTLDLSLPRSKRRSCVGNRLRSDQVRKSACGACKHTLVQAPAMLLPGAVLGFSPYE